MDYRRGSGQVGEGKQKVAGSIGKGEEINWKVCECGIEKCGRHRRMKEGIREHRNREGVK